MNANALLKRFLAAALLASTLLAGNLGVAQPAPKPAAQRNSPYLLEIEGGWLLQPTGNKLEATLDNVVERLRELELMRNGDPANIVLSPDLPKIKIVNLKLAATTLAQELEALRVASGEQFLWSVGSGASSYYPTIDPATGLPVAVDPSALPPGQAEAKAPLYILRPAAQAPKGLLRVEAFSLAGYFESRKKSGNEKEYQQMVEEEIQQLHRIVEETVAIYVGMNRELNVGGKASASSPSLRFHRGANLLIVTGEIDGVEIAAKVIAALPHVQRSGGNVTEMGIPGMPGPAAEAFKSRYGIYPQPGVGAPGGSPVTR